MSLITTTEAAAILGCSSRTVQRLIADGLLAPAQKLPGPNGAYLLDSDDVTKYAQEKASSELEERTGSEPR